MALLKIIVAPYAEMIFLRSMLTLAGMHNSTG